jgi:anthranilate/para-aminobenzoate synthase component I/branched-subunit amino acid aminotransferase/4-amino-4-deoxychorismate lyase
MRMPRLAAWAGFDGLPSPLALLAPDEVVEAHALGDVLPAVARVEAAVRAGATAVGMLAYEAAPAFDPAMVTRPPLPGFPLAWFAVCRPGSATSAVAAPAAWEDVAAQCELAVPPAAAAAAAAVAVAGDRHHQRQQQQQLQPPPPSAAARGSYAATEWRPDVTREAYNAAIAGVKDAIREGNSYQVNYTLRLGARIGGDHGALLTNLLRAQRCGYGAFLDTGRWAVLSASPELFFRWDQATGAIATRPMKGTAPRGLAAEDDEAARAALAASVKNRAENLMIVDLLRNDVGRIARRGTVRVPSLFAVEAYPTVFQMTSTVTAVTPTGRGAGAADAGAAAAAAPAASSSHDGGSCGSGTAPPSPPAQPAEQQPATSLVDVLTALFPCGSITGAPKLSTMRLIAELEAAPRAVYCGAILALTPQPLADGSDGQPHALRVVASVPIRTLLVDKHSPSSSPSGEEDGAGCAAVYGVGGGVTWDSTPDGEYDEVLDKAAVLRVACRAQAAGAPAAVAGSAHGAKPAPSASASPPGAVEPASVGPLTLGDAMRGPEFSLLETLRLDYYPSFAAGGGGGPAAATAGHRYVLLPQHLARLRASARYFGSFAYDEPAVVAALEAHAAQHAPSAPPPARLASPTSASANVRAGADDDSATTAVVAASRRVRLLLHPRTGGVTVESSPLEAPLSVPADLPAAAARAMAGMTGGGDSTLPAQRHLQQQPPPPAQRVVVSPVPVPTRHVFLYHKTTQRGVYEAHASAARRADAAAAAAHGDDEGGGTSCSKHAQGAAAAAAAAAAAPLFDVLLWSARPQAQQALPSTADEPTPSSSVEQQQRMRRVASTPAALGGGSSAAAAAAAAAAATAVASECTIGNVVFELELGDTDGAGGNGDDGADSGNRDGAGAGAAAGVQLVTPPVADGCLPGTLRAALLAAGAVAEAPVPLAAARTARRAWLINSVRGWVPLALDWRQFDAAAEHAGACQ